MDDALVDVLDVERRALNRLETKLNEQTLNGWYKLAQQTAAEIERQCFRLEAMERMAEAVQQRLDGGTILTEDDLMRLPHKPQGTLVALTLNEALKYDGSMNPVAYDPDQKIAYFKRVEEPTTPKAPK